MNKEVHTNIVRIIKRINLENIDTQLAELEKILASLPPDSDINTTHPIECGYPGTILEVALEQFLHSLSSPSIPSQALLKVIGLFLARGANPNSLAGFSKIPLLHIIASDRSAVRYNQENWKAIEDLMKLFYHAKINADFNILDTQKNTAAHRAALIKNYRFISVLHKFGCGLNRRNRGTEKPETVYDIVFEQAKSESHEASEALKDLKAMGARPGDDTQKSIAEYKHHVRQQKIAAAPDRITAFKESIVSITSYADTFTEEYQVNALVRDGNIHELVNGRSRAHRAVDAREPNALVVFCKAGGDLTIKTAPGADGTVGQTAVDCILAAPGTAYDFLQHDAVMIAINSQFDMETIRRCTAILRAHDEENEAKAVMEAKTAAIAVAAPPAAAAASSAPKPLDKEELKRINTLCLINGYEKFKAIALNFSSTQWEQAEVDATSWKPPVKKKFSEFRERLQKEAATQNTPAEIVARINLAGSMQPLPNKAMEQNASDAAATTHVANAPTP